jgi:branched-chain amino acid transport system permease protein
VAPRWRIRLPLGLALLAAAAFVPLQVRDPVYLDLYILGAYYLILAASWNVIAGFAGQISFAHVALASVGAYSSGLLFADPDRLGLPAAIAFVLAGLVAALAGLGLGLVSLRVRGIYFSLITFGFAGAWTVWVAGADGITGGTIGHEVPFLFEEIELTKPATVAFALVAAYFLLQSALLDSRLGIEAMAVRDREAVAEGLGIRTVRVKLAIFVYTSFWAGVAGAFYGSYVGIIAPTLSGLDEMALVASIAIIGGFGSRLGPVVGLVLVRWVDYEVRGTGEAEYTTLIVAALTVAIMLFARDGIVGLGQAAWRRARPQARWLDEPPPEPASVGPR